MDKHENLGHSAAAWLLPICVIKMHFWLIYFLYVFFLAAYVLQHLAFFFWLSLKRAYILIRLASIYFSNPNVLTCIFMVFRYISMYPEVMYNLFKYPMAFFRKTNSCTTLRNVCYIHFFFTFYFTPKKNGFISICNKKNVHKCYTNINKYSW